MSETKDKDPAFLFYSHKFYEGTRTMSPEERACYVDLLIYQHQKGIIPNDIERLSKYCSGCSENIVKYVLSEKFDQTVNGWLSKKLNKVVDDRTEYKMTKIASATLAGLISSSKISKKIIKKIKTEFKISEFIKENEILINDETLVKLKVRQWFNQMVKQMVDNARYNSNFNIKEDKGVIGEKEDMPKFNFLQQNEIPISELEREVENDEKNIQELAMAYRISPEIVKIKLKQFASKQKFDTGNDCPTMGRKQFRVYFSNWLGKNLDTNTTPQKNEPTRPKIELG